MMEQASSDRAHTWLVELAHKHRVSPTHRRIVQYMLGSLPDVAFASTIDIAAAAGVSQPIVTRLAVALGYPGYPEFRTAIRDVLRSQAASISVVANGPERPTELGIEQENIAALERTFAGDQMAKAIDLLAGTQPLGIIGLRVSSALAEYMAYFARHVLPDVRVLNDASSVHDAVLQLHRNGATTVLAFVMPHYPTATLDALTYARKLGMATVAIVDSPVVPFIDDVDALLVAQVGTELVFDSHAAPVVLAISLLDAIAERNAERTRAALEAHEELVERWALTTR